MSQSRLLRWAVFTLLLAGCWSATVDAGTPLDGLFTFKRVEADPDKRTAIYQEAEMLIHEDVARVPVVWTSGTVVLRNEVKGYTPVVFRSWSEYLSIEK